MQIEPSQKGTHTDERMMLKMFLSVRIRQMNNVLLMVYKLIICSCMSFLHYVKSVQIRSNFCSVFSRIRTEYGSIEVSLRIQSECGKIRTRNYSVFGQKISCIIAIVDKKIKIVFFVSGVLSSPPHSAVQISFFSLALFCPRTLNGRGKN